MRVAHALAGLGLAAALWPAHAADTAIPDFTSITSGWLLAGGTDWANPPAGVQGPVVNDPKYPHVGNNQGAQPTERIADVTDPNLKSWAAEKIAKTNDQIINQHRRGFVAQSWCWPGGVPGQLLVPAEPIFFIQTPKIVYIMWQRDQNVRRIYMDQPHSANVKPSVYGESVGHYEGDELIIDTVGLETGDLLFVDNYRTPFTKDLHVVERWKLINDGKGLQATVMVDDPGTFNKPWTGSARWNKVNRGAMIESYCAENNLMGFDSLDRWPMPEAKQADF